MSTFTMQEQELDQWCWVAVGVSVNNYIAPNPPVTQEALAAHVLSGCNGNLDNPACDRPASLTEVLDLLHRQAGAPILAPVSFAQIRHALDGGSPIPPRTGWHDTSWNH